MLKLLALVLAGVQAQNSTNSTADETVTNVTVTGAWTDINCPTGCFAQLVGQDQYQCVCPVEDDSAATEDNDIRANCNPEIEACGGYVQVIDVGIGFSYQESANMWYGLTALAMMVYSSWAPGGFSTADSMRAAWTYNFFWMFATWGITLFLWTQQQLFKSEGGLMHSLYVKWVNFGVINFFFAYWATDFMLLYQTLDYTAAEGEDKNTWYFKVFGLGGVQIFTIIMSMLYRSSINFDWDLINAVPEPITQASLEVEEEF